MEHLLPEGFRWREFWDFKNLSNDSITASLIDIPSKVFGGHKLTLTNEAAKKTTVDGVQFTGIVSSVMTVPADAVLNNQTKFWVYIRLKFNETFSSASLGNRHLMDKVNLGQNMSLRFDTTDGKLYFAGTDGANPFSLVSTTESWTEGQWYTIIASISDTGPTQRLLINGVLEDSDTAVACNTPAAGDLLIGNSVGVGTDGFIGVISDIVIGTDNLTTTAGTGEEALLAKGIPPADAVNLYRMDEGRGVTCTCRGSGSNDGTLGVIPTWSFGQTKLSCLSLDGIDDYAASQSGVNITAPHTLIWAGKLKSTYVSIPSERTFVEIYIDASNSLRLFASTTDIFGFYTEGSNTPKTLSVAVSHSIDDYIIFMGVTLADGTSAFYVNGALVDSETGGGVISAAAATAYLGSNNVPNEFDVSKSGICGLVHGGFSVRDVLLTSRKIDRRYKLGIGI